MMLFQFMDFSNMKTEEVFDAADPMAQHGIAMRNPEYQRIMKIELPRLIGLGIVG